MSFKRPACSQKTYWVGPVGDFWRMRLLCHSLFFYTFLCCLKYFQCTATTLNKNFVLSILYLRYNYGCYMFLPYKQVYYGKRTPSCTGKSIPLSQHFPKYTIVIHPLLWLFTDRILLFFRHHPPFECFSVPATLPWRITSSLPNEEVCFRMLSESDLFPHVLPYHVPGPCEWPNILLLLLVSC